MSASPFTANIARSMRTTALVRRKTGVDKFNKATYAAGVAVLCQVEDNNRIVRSATGEEVVSSTTLYLAEHIAVEPDDHVVVEGVERHIIGVGQNTTAHGYAPTRLYLQ